MTTSTSHAIPLSTRREAHSAVAVRHTPHHTKLTTQNGHQERKPSTSGQPTKENIPSNPLTEAHNTQIKTKGPREEVTTSPSHAIPLPTQREAHSLVAATHIPHHTKVTTQSGHQEHKPLTSGAHFTQNTHTRLAYGDSRQFAPDPITNPPSQTHTQRARPHTLPTHCADNTDRDMHIDSAPCQTPAQCESYDIHTLPMASPVRLNT